MDHAQINRMIINIVHAIEINHEIQKDGTIKVTLTLGDTVFSETYIDPIRV